MLWLDEPSGAALESGSLTSEELARAGTFSVPAAAHRYATARALVRRAAGEVLGMAPASLDLGRRCPACDATDHGPPDLPGSGLRISVAHCDGLVGVAIAGGPVGLDLERVRALASSPAVLRRVATISESARIRDLDARDAIRLWCAKEAVGKLRGRGLLDARRLDTGELFGWPALAATAAWVREIDCGAGHACTVAQTTEAGVEVRSRPGSLPALPVAGPAIRIGLVRRPEEAGP